MFLGGIWSAMTKAIRAGLNAEGRLPGTLKVPRKASAYHARAQSAAGYFGETALLFAYALAVSEENASGGEVVTAPTCGACGVLPAVLYFLQQQSSLPDEKIVRALATAGLVGNIVKRNASISGAEVGCQGEVGTACAMAAAGRGATSRRFGAADRICGGNGLGAPSRPDLRPDWRLCTDSVHRAQRHRGGARRRLRYLCPAFRRASISCRSTKWCIPCGKPAAI